MAGNQEEKGSNISLLKGAPEISSTSQYQNNPMIKAEDGGCIWRVHNSATIFITQHKFQAR